MAKINYTDTGLQEWQGAVTKYPIFPFFGLGTPTIIIRPKFENDKGILKHELKHIEQYKKDWFFLLKYKYSKDYRFKCELEAYKEQLIEYKYTDIKQAGWLIDALVNKYNLDIPVRFIIKKIEELIEEINK